MKKTIFIEIILLLCSSLFVNAQQFTMSRIVTSEAVNTKQIMLPANAPFYSPYFPKLSMTKDSLKVNPERNLSERSMIDPLLPTAGSDEWVYSFFVEQNGVEDTKFITGEEFQLDIIRFRNKTKTYDYPLSINEKRSQSNFIYLKPILNGLNAMIGDVIQVEYLSSSTEPNITLALKYFRYWDKISLYNMGDSYTYGIHIPIGMFGISKGENGLVLSSLLVGIAWGGKYYISPDFYLGLGLPMVNYQISPDETNSGSITFSTVAIGGYIDINNIVKIGYSYSFSFSSIEDKGNITIGFGSILSGMLGK